MRVVIAVMRPAPAAPEPGERAAEVEADEEDDEALDDRRQVAGELRAEDRRVELPARGAVDQRAEEQRCEADADRGVAAEQGGGEADEADLARVDVALADAVLPAGDVDGAREPGERARDRHREEVVPRDRDAAVASGLGIEADRAHLVAEGRAVDDDPVDDEHRERDEDPDREALQEREAPEDRQLRAFGDVVRDRDGDLARPAAGRPARRGTRPPRSRSS